MTGFSTSHAPMKSVQDFLFCLLIREDLAKPAGNLYLHNLNGILETAIRATNAQFDDADILKRLDVRLLEVDTTHDDDNNNSGRFCGT